MTRRQGTDCLTPELIPCKILDLTKRELNMTTKCKRINDGLKLRQTSTFELYDEEFRLIRTVDEQVLEDVLEFLECAVDAGYLDASLLFVLERFFHPEENV